MLQTPPSITPEKQEGVGGEMLHPRAGLRPSPPLLSVPAGRARSSFTAKNAMLRPAGSWLTFPFLFVFQPISVSW